MLSAVAMLFINFLVPAISETAPAGRAIPSGPVLPSGLFAEHREIRIFVGRVLLVFRIADEIDAQTLQPPSLYHWPVAHELHIVVLVGDRQTDRMGAVMGPRFEKNTALRRLDVPSKF